MLYVARYSSRYRACFESYWGVPNTCRVSLTLRVVMHLLDRVTLAPTAANSDELSDILQTGTPQAAASDESVRQLSRTTARLRALPFSLGFRVCTDKGADFAVGFRSTKVVVQVSLEVTCRPVFSERHEATEKPTRSSTAAPGSPDVMRRQCLTEMAEMASHSRRKRACQLISASGFCAFVCVILPWCGRG